MKRLQAQSVMDLTEVLQHTSFDHVRSEELAGEVSGLIAAVESFSPSLHFDLEPSQFQAYIAGWKVEG